MSKRSVYKDARVKAKFHYAIQLAASSQASLPLAHKLVRELSAIELLAKTCVRMSQTKFHYAIQLVTSSPAGLRPACELVADLLASKLA